ncbi:hypothetical protein COOONC_15221 [Cooperia oncophora]
MRLRLIESLQNKIAVVEKEREDGEVTDEDGSGTSRPTSRSRKEGPVSSRLRKTVTRKSVHLDRRDGPNDRDRKRSSERSSSRIVDNHRRHSTQRSYISEKKPARTSTRGSVSGSHSDNQERKDRGGSSALHSSSSSSHRSKRQREETQGKTPLSSSKARCGLSSALTLPSSQISPNTDFVLSTLKEKKKSSVSDRIVEASTSHVGNESRPFKRVVDSGNHISVTVNAHRGNTADIFSQTRTVSQGGRPTENTVTSGLTSSPHSSKSTTVMNHLLSNGSDGLPHIPLPPTPTPFRPQAPPTVNDKNFVLLPPPPAPPILPKPASMVGSCNPSSIRIQVREGGGRVAQLSTTAKPNDTAPFSQRTRPISIHIPSHIGPQLSNLSEKTDNYEDVGMDVESSHSSCDSDTGHGDNEGIV